MARVCRMLLLPVLALGACNFTSRTASSIDAAPESDTAIDAPDAAPLGAWGPATRLTELNSPSLDDDPTLTDDLLEIYFASQRGGSEDIYRATRLSVTEAFGAPRRVDELSELGVIDSNVDVSGDGLVITFTRGTDIVFARRASRSDPWPTPQPAPGLSSTAGDWGAVLSDDLRTAVLCSDRGGDEALFESSRATERDAWSMPVELSSIETVGDECNGMFPEPGTLYFTRNDFHNDADLDLYVAQRIGTTFEPAMALDTLNTTPTRDSDPWVSPDQRTIVFSSNRAGGLGSDDLYISTR